MGRCRGIAHERMTRSERSAPVTSHEWGRVDDDGTVYVRTADGERAVGQYPEGTPEEALAVLHRAVRRARVRGRAAREADQVRRDVARGGRARRCDRRARRSPTRTPSATSASLAARLDALAPVIEQQREARKAERAQRAAESRRARSRSSREAEKLAEGSDWRNGANRLRELLDEWKALPRHRPGLRRRPVAALLDRAHGVHPAPQGALRRAAREAGRRPRSSRSGWPPRPRRSPAPPSGVRPRAATAT